MGSALVGYGLGNFVWYGTSDLSTRTGVLLVTVTGRKVSATAGCRRGSSTGYPAPLAGDEAPERAGVLALAPRLHRPEALGAGLHLAVPGR